jgi:hypothetical protein
MQQNPPSIPLSDAALPAAIPTPYRITRRRLLAIVALGLTSALFFSPIGVGPWWWQPILAAGVLFAAVLLNAILTRSAGSGRSIGAALRGSVATGVASGVLGVAILVAAGLSYTTQSGVYNYRDAGITSFVWALLEAVLVAVLVGLVCALVAQSQPSSPLAVLGAILGWSAATVANLAGTVLGQSGPAATANGTQVPFVVIFYLLWGGLGGLALALLGGLLGRALRSLAKNSATQ